MNSNSQSNRERFRVLLERFFEHPQDESLRAELKSLMEANPDLLRVYFNQTTAHLVLESHLQLPEGHLAQLLPQENQGAFEFALLTAGGVDGDEDSGTSTDDQRATTLRRAVSVAGGENTQSRMADTMLRRSMFPWIIAASLLIATVGLSGYLSPSRPVAVADVEDESNSERGISFVGFSSAKFFKQSIPPIGTKPEANHEFALTEGIVQLESPLGAVATIEGPAVFEIDGPEAVRLSVGRCSVYAPPGAEGFSVRSRTTEIVDRGTRFIVSVGETNETDVQVIEGAADVYQLDASVKRSNSAVTESNPIRVVGGQAVKYSTASDSQSVDFDASDYRYHLPDRVVSYEATDGVGGGAEKLISVSVQRGGVVERIPISAMSPGQVIYFKGCDSNVCYCSGRKSAGGSAFGTAEPLLNQGVLNPGGSLEPLTSSPQLNGPDSPAGIAVQFAQPVVNGPGADVVLFDLQCYIDPIDGDGFHVSPLKFREGLRSATIDKYDLTLDSPNVRRVEDFECYVYLEQCKSLEDLLMPPEIKRPPSVSFYAIAVGINLSDLGYTEGEETDGLFIQDSKSDSRFIDPVFIGGLPLPDRESATSSASSKSS